MIKYAVCPAWTFIYTVSRMFDPTVILAASTMINTLSLTISRYRDRNKLHNAFGARCILEGIYLDLRTYISLNIQHCDVHCHAMQWRFALVQEISGNKRDEKGNEVSSREKMPIIFPKQPALSVAFYVT